MHQGKVSAYSPQRRCAQLICRTLSAVLHNPISGSDVMQKEVAERMEGLVAQSGRHGELSLVDHGSCGYRGEGLHVADGATDGVEDLRAGLRIARRRQRGVPRRCLGSAHEAGKVIDVLQSVGTGLVLGISRSLAYRGRVRGVEAVADALLIQISIAGER